LNPNQVAMSPELRHHMTVFFEEDVGESCLFGRMEDASIDGNGNGNNNH